MWFRDGYLQPLILQVLGVVMLVGFTLFWLITGHESALLVGAALTLIGTGAASGRIMAVRDEIERGPTEKKPRSPSQKRSKPRDSKDDNSKMEEQ